MSPPLLFCKKGTTHKTVSGEAKKKTDFQETFSFIANKLFELPQYNFDSSNS
jgi:hypothetical protein